MRKVYISIICVILFFQNSFAITLPEALLQAYKNNPELNAERENIEVSKEDLNISKSEYLPSVTLSGSKSRENTDKLTNQSGVDQSINDANPLTQSIKIEQTLIDFGRKADLQKNKIGINLASAKLKKKNKKFY